MPSASSLPKSLDGNLRPLALSPPAHPNSKAGSLDAQCAPFLVHRTRLRGERSRLLAGAKDRPRTTPAAISSIKDLPRSIYLSSGSKNYCQRTPVSGRFGFCFRFSRSLLPYIRILIINTRVLGVATRSSVRLHTDKSNCDRTPGLSHCVAWSCQLDWYTQTGVFAVSRHS